MSPCGPTGGKPVGGKVIEFTARVSTQTCGRLAQGQSGRTQAELLEGMLTFQSFVTTPEQILNKTTDLKYDSFAQPSPILLPANNSKAARSQRGRFSAGRLFQHDLVA